MSLLCVWSICVHLTQTSPVLYWFSWFILIPPKDHTLHSSTVPSQPMLPIRFSRPERFTNVKYWIILYCKHCHVRNNWNCMTNSAWCITVASQAVTRHPLEENCESSTYRRLHGQHAAISQDLWQLLPGFCRMPQPSIWEILARFSGNCTPAFVLQHLYIFTVIILKCN